MSPALKARHPQLELVVALENAMMGPVLYLLLASLQLTALAIRRDRGRNGGQPIEEVIADAQRADDRDQPRIDRA